ncbi:PREDICTED: 3-hydroxyacyl-CoA dehydrogenase type-2-like [Habropoda laboriosa]|uniref:3-hydroxyacyl-CoA dehydrogenase type-2-like n=1 Tax=Habropoda laboriosa TaxID=597456 RepID=UPI00083D0C3C|nr:PREDICTED: 3-hydroxyacyl-CoA dehydrogenase type-2-like [Habropoda laboriosa]
MGKMQHIVAYITGGANGIGKAIAEKILCEGGKVVLADISCNGAKVAESMGEKALYTCTDVRIEKDVLDSMKCVKDKFGGVNVLINSAGVAGYEALYDFKNKKPHSIEMYRCLFDTNVWGLFNVTRLMVGLMAENKPDANQQRGVIINLSSMMAYEPPPTMVAYGSTKSAVSGMTVPMARGLAQSGIRVVGICPGYIESPMTAVQKPEEKKHWVTMKLTPKRYGTCEEVAHLIQACIENPLINAENIRIDMGFRYSQVGDSQQDSKC